MASSALQILSLLLALAGFTVLLLTTMSNRWKISGSTAVLVPSDWISEGLWMDCGITDFGAIQCRKFLYMLSSESKCVCVYKIQRCIFVLSFCAANWCSWTAYSWGWHRGSSMERICPSVLLDRLKDPWEICVLCPPFSPITAVPLLPCLFWFYLFHLVSFLTTSRQYVSKCFSVRQVLDITQLIWLCAKSVCLL